VEGQLAAECLNALDRSERVLAHKAVSQLLEIGAAYPYTHLLMARVMIRDGDYSNAARHIVTAQLLDGGKKTMKKELPVILEEIGTRLAKGAAPAALIDIVVFTLSAGDHISVKKWAESENYWLQRNAELIRKKSQLERE